MNNCAGISRDVIMSKDAFEQLVRCSIEQLHSPTQQCLSMVTRELLQIAQDAEPTEALWCATHQCPHLLALCGITCAMLPSGAVWLCRCQSLQTSVLLLGDELHKC
jgi:hypothetical protein